MESWDEDPEARLTAANIASQLQSFEARNAWLEERSRESATCDITTQDNQCQAQLHSEIVVSLSDNSSQNTDNSNGLITYGVTAVDVHD